MKIVQGDFVKGSAVVYKKEDGALVAGLQFEDGSYKWFYDRTLRRFKCDRAILNDGVSMIYINRQGDPINHFDFLAADDFSEDRAFATDGMSTYLLDTEGRVIREWDEAFVTTRFNKGTALLQRMSEDGSAVEEALVDIYGNIMAGFAPRRTIIEPVDIFIDEPEEEWYEGLQHFYNSEGFGVRDRFGNELIRERGLEDIF